TLIRRLTSIFSLYLHDSLPIFSFLSIIPATRHSTTIDIYSVAKVMYLFPIAGAIIGIMVGIFAYSISFYVPPLLLGLFVTAALEIGRAHVCTPVTVASLMPSFS